MRLFESFAAAGVFVIAGQVACGQGVGVQESPSAKMAGAVMQRWPTGVVTTENKPGEWAYEEGVLLDGMAAQWHTTANGDYFRYIKTAVDKYVMEDGSIQMNKEGGKYPVDAHSLDNIEMGRAVLLLYRVTHEERYAKAAKFLQDQLAAQPRTPSGAYWHKQIYPNQVWLDGAYMAGPFKAAYAAMFTQPGFTQPGFTQPGYKQPGDFDDIAKELLLMDLHMRDVHTGLLRHGWDDSPANKMPWADARTGLSPEAWARAMGWYAVALVDVLDWFPKDHPERRELISALNRTMTAAVHYQDKKTGLWWQVLDKGGKAGNFHEASASCMFVYALAKGARLGYLAHSDEVAAKRGWSGIQKAFVGVGPDGLLALNGTVKVGGLGGKPYRSGTYEYYIGEKTIANDAKGLGAFLMAGAEMEQAAKGKRGQGKTALMDAW